MILENTLSHPIMKELLPLLSDHINDTAERVRIAFMDLLIKVKELKSIKVHT